MVQPKTIIFKQVPSSVLAKPLNSTKAASVHPSTNGLQESSSTLAALLKLKEDSSVHPNIDSVEHVPSSKVAISLYSKNVSSVHPKT